MELGRCRAELEEGLYACDSQVCLNTGQPASAFHHLSASINLKPGFAHRYALSPWLMAHHHCKNTLLNSNSPPLLAWLNLRDLNLSLQANYLLLEVIISAFPLSALCTLLHMCIPPYV